MIQDHYSSPAERQAPITRPRKNPGLIVLLSFLTLSNTFALVLGVVSWADWSDHGSRYDVIELRAAIFTTVLSVVALVALGGAWFTRKWGPRVYASASVLGLIIGVVNAEGAFSPLSLVGILIAIGLWWHAETNW